MLLGDEAFGNCISHEGEVLINAFIKENPQRSLALFHHVKTKQEATISEQERALSRHCI